MTKLNEVKNAIMQVIYFLNSPAFNMLFYCHIILFWEKVDFLWKILPWSCPWPWISNCLENLSVSVLLMEISKCWKMVEFSKNYNQNEELKKRSTRPKLWANLRKLFCLPPSPHHQMKSYYVFGTKMFLIRYTEIYRNIQKIAFKVFQEWSFWESRNGAV